MRCKHGLDISYCVYCNGETDKKQNYFKAIKTKRKNQKEITKKMRKYQKLSIKNAIRYKAPIENWEIETFIKETSNIKDIQRLFTLSIDFNRTFYALNWLWSLTYTSKRFSKAKSNATALIERIKEVIKNERPIQYSRDTIGKGTE